jgi:predicted DNA-binding transcriptional regulator AlpA
MITFSQLSPHAAHQSVAEDVTSTQVDSKSDVASRVVAPRTSTFQRFLPHLDQLPDTHPIKVPAAAEMCGVHRTTLWRWIREGLLPRPTKIGNAATFPLGLIRAIQRNGLASKKKADLSLRTGG